MPIFNLRELAYPRVAAALYKNALLSLFLYSTDFRTKMPGPWENPDIGRNRPDSKKLLERLRSGWLHGDGKPPLISVRSKPMRVLRKGLEIS